MVLQGKRINFLGDSITYGHGTSSPDKRFTNLLKDRLQLAAANNYGISGTRIAVQSKPSTDPTWDLDFCTRASQMDPDADVIVVFGGTNDFGHGDAPIGCMSDRTPDTFYGACHTLMQTLITRYPGAVIVFLTPLHRCNEDNPRGDGGKPEDVGVLSRYVDILRETARWYSLPVLDLFAVSGLQPRVPAIQSRYIPDGLHPNDAGHEILADRIESFLRAL